MSGRVACHYCGAGEDLRPYGPGGAMVCFPCATATPEREAEAKGAFGALLGAAEAVGGGVVTLDSRTNEGPLPGLQLPEADS